MSTVSDDRGGTIRSAADRRPSDDPDRSPPPVGVVWPTCKAACHAVMLDLLLDCVLPDGHQYDGNDMHLSSRDVAGGQVSWSMTWKPLDDE